MGFFGFKSAKEVAAEKDAARQQGKNEAFKETGRCLHNLGAGSQFTISIPYFDVFDPRFTDYSVPVVVRVSVTYGIEDMDKFLDCNKIEKFDNDVFKEKLRGNIAKHVKSVVGNIPSEYNIPVVQLERKISEISDIVQEKVIPQVEKTYCIQVRQLDVTEIGVDKSSRGYRELRALTADLEKDMVMAQHNAKMTNFNMQNTMQQETMMAQHNANISNFNLQNDLQQNQLRMQSHLNLDAMQRQQEMQLGGQEEMQAMQLEHQREMMRIQREEMQRASKLQTEQTFMGAHQANLQAGMMNNAIDNGINTFAGGNMGGMQQMQNMGYMQQQMPGMGAMPQMPGMGGMPQMPGMKTMTPQVSYMIAVNGQQAGPFDWNQLQQLVQQGQLNQQTYVWKQGMANWEFAGNVQELQPLFMGSMPQMPGMPR